MHPRILFATVLGACVCSCAGPRLHVQGPGEDVQPMVSEIEGGYTLAVAREVAEPYPADLGLSEEVLHELGSQRRVFQLKGGSFGNCTVSSSSYIAFNSNGRAKMVLKVKSESNNKTIQGIMSTWHLDGQFLFHTPHQTPGWFTVKQTKTGKKNTWHEWTVNFRYPPELFMVVLPKSLWLRCG